MGGGQGERFAGFHHDQIGAGRIRADGVVGRVGHDRVGSEGDRGVAAGVVGDRSVAVIGHRPVGLVVGRERFAERNAAVPRVDHVFGGRDDHRRRFGSENRRLNRRVSGNGVVPGIVAGKGVGDRNIVGSGIGRLETAVGGDGHIVGSENPGNRTERDIRIGIAIEPLTGDRGAGHRNRCRRDARRIGRCRCTKLVVPLVGTLQLVIDRHGVIIDVLAGKPGTGGHRHVFAGNDSRIGSFRDLSRCTAVIDLVFDGVAGNRDDCRGDRGGKGLVGRLGVVAGPGSADTVGHGNTGVVDVLGGEHARGSDGDRIAFTDPGNVSEGDVRGIGPVIGAGFRRGGNGELFRGDHAGHERRSAVPVHVGVADMDRIGTDIVIGRRGGAPGCTVHGIFDGRGNNRAVDTDEVLVGSVIDFRQAGNPVIEELERAVILDVVDRTGTARQVFRRTGRNRRGVDRNRTDRELVRFAVIGSADEEGFARMILGRIGVNGTVYRLGLIEGFVVVNPAVFVRPRSQDDRACQGRAYINILRTVNIKILAGPAGRLVPGNG